MKTLQEMIDSGKMLHILSLGAGVQSSTMALMSARGDLPKPDAAIFADTGHEPRFGEVFCPETNKYIGGDIRMVGLFEV